MNIRDLLATERRDTIERWFRERARTVHLRENDVLARVLGEHMMVLDMDDISIAPHLALDGYWEIWLSMCLAKRLKPGWRCVDVGANFGYFTLLMALITGAEVEAWEPMKDLEQRLVKTVRLNGLTSRVTIVPYAAGAKEDQGTLFRLPWDYGSGSLNPRHLVQSLTTGGDLVDVCRLDDDSVRAVDFIKIDAEGTEDAVWAGMKGILDRTGDDALKAVLMEWTPSRYSNPVAFLADIRRRGFTVNVIDASGGISQALGDITQIEGHTDLWLQR